MALTEKQKEWHRNWHQKNKLRRNTERRDRYNADPEHRRKLIDSAGRYAKANAFEIRAKRYGLTPDELELALDKGCQICGAWNGYGLIPPPKALHVDHCHKTGRFRGILCQYCNLGVGAFFDNPLWLTKAADYIVKAVRAHGLATIPE